MTAPLQILKVCNNDDDHPSMGRATTFLLILIMAVGCCTSRAWGQYLDPLGDGKAFGCGVADNAKTVFAVGSNGARLKIPKHKVQLFIQKLKKGDRQKKKLASDFQKCLNGKIKTSNACDIITPGVKGEARTSIVQGRLCSQAPSAVVSIVSYINGSESQRCTGIVLTPQIVLTAAHCLYEEELPATSAVVTTSAGEFESERVGYMSAAVEPKPAFEYYDIGFITFDSPISGALSVGIIPSTSPIQSGEKAIVSGFGYDENKLSGDLIAGYMSLEQVGEELMTAKFGGYPGESATCPGDSGGPLLVKRNGSWVLAGITSYGPLDCGPNARFGFTNIMHGPLYDFLADSTCVTSTAESGCPFFLIGG